MNFRKRSTKISCFNVAVNDQQKASAKLGFACNHPLSYWFTRMSVFKGCYIKIDLPMTGCKPLKAFPGAMDRVAVTVHGHEPKQDRNGHPKDFATDRGQASRQSRRSRRRGWTERTTWNLILGSFTVYLTTCKM